jgi:hypothetical protein
VSWLAGLAFPLVWFARRAPPALAGDARRVAQLLGALGWLWVLFAFVLELFWPDPAGWAGALLAFLAVLWAIGYVKRSWETGKDPHGHGLLTFAITGFLLAAVQILMSLTRARVSLFDVWGVAQAGLLLGVLLFRNRALRASPPEAAQGKGA